MERIDKEEVNRKLLHILAVTLPVFVFYAPLWFEFSRFFTSMMVLILFIFSLAVDLLRVKVQALQKFIQKLLVQ